MHVNVTLFHMYAQKRHAYFFTMIIWSEDILYTYNQLNGLKKGAPMTTIKHCAVC